VIVLPRLYPIVNVADATDRSLERSRRLVRDLAAAGVSLVQLRAKPLAGGPFTELAIDVVRATGAHGCRVIVNDRADVALAAGATGVHVGDEDLPVEAVRRVVGPDLIVGYSTHSVEEVEAAADLAVDYIGFGPVFESPTKPGVRAPRGIDLLHAVCRASRHPVVAIGGITRENSRLAWEAGAASVAAISEFERAEDVAALLRQWR
jgi:thiamine-phosphate pyrophosphorylase